MTKRILTESLQSEDRPGKNDSWVTYKVKPNRSPKGEYVWVDIEAKMSHGGGIAHFQLSRNDAFDFAYALQHAAEWLRDEEDRNG